MLKIVKKADKRKYIAYTVYGYVYDIRGKQWK